MKRLLLIALICVLPLLSEAQTFHAIIFANKQEAGRENMRTNEFNNMSDFCRDIATALGYKFNLIRHSGEEFTETVLKREIDNLYVNDNDIVLFYYYGHGVNYDQDEWPHMCLGYNGPGRSNPNRSNYWVTDAFKRLVGKSTNAKLTLCIASCCNMDSEGRRQRSYGNSQIIPSRARQLFLGFNGTKQILASSSKKGQYTWSISEGSIYTIHLRQVVRDALTGTSSTALNWNAILNTTADRTFRDTSERSRYGICEPQMPQYKIFENGNINVPVTRSNQLSSSNVSASVTRMSVRHNVVAGWQNCIEFTVDFETHNVMRGGEVVILFERPKGSYITNTYGAPKMYTNQGNQICAWASFGSHYQHARYTNYKMYMPLSALNPPYGKTTYYCRAHIWDTDTKKYVATGDYYAFDITK